MSAVPAYRAIELWQPPRREEALEEAARKAEVARVRQAELAARTAIAERRTRQAKIHEASEKLVLSQLEKLLRLAESPDYKDSPGPVELKDLIKLAELAGKDFRLDTGQATENVAMAIGPSVDFTRMTQAEREEWRRLAIKGGGSDE